MILGGPESEPFARQDSAIKETRNLPVFMVPDEEYPNATIISFADLFAEISNRQQIRRVGMVGLDQMPVSVYRQIFDSFKNVELIDITEDFLRLRHHKSAWEREQIRTAFGMAWQSYLKMAAAVQPGAREYEVAAAGEAIARQNGATSFAFKRSSAARARGSMRGADRNGLGTESPVKVMLGIAPRSKGYAGVHRPYGAGRGHLQPLLKEYLQSHEGSAVLTRGRAETQECAAKRLNAPGRA